MQNQKDAKKKLKLLFSGAFIPLLLYSVLISQGCDSGYTLSAAETDVVVTNYDAGFDFSAQSTFSLPDEVQVSNPDDPDDGEDLGPQFSDLIIQETEKQMTARGYILETDPDTNPPDLEITIFATNSDVYGTGGGYCWYYYGYCYWYYPPTTYYLYSTGTIFTHMSDPDAPDTEDGGRPPVWTAGINGVLNDSTGEVSSRIVSRIDQSFAQSPYLNAN